MSDKPRSEIRYFAKRALRELKETQKRLQIIVERDVDAPTLDIDCLIRIQRAQIELESLQCLLIALVSPPTAIATLRKIRGTQDVPVSSSAINEIDELVAAIRNRRFIEAMARAKRALDNGNITS